MGDLSTLSHIFIYSVISISPAHGYLFYNLGYNPMLQYLFYCSNYTSLEPLRALSVGYSVSLIYLQCFGFFDYCLTFWHDKNTY